MHNNIIQKIFLGLLILFLIIILCGCETMVTMINKDRKMSDLAHMFQSESSSEETFFKKVEIKKEINKIDMWIRENLW